jgi:nucleoside-diphosphate-sugar epimerase
MKVLITGATGNIGKEALNQALSRPEITSVVALTRRSLPSHVSTNPKLETVIMNDFSDWTPNILDEIKDADAMIWLVFYTCSRQIECLMSITNSL